MDVSEYPVSGNSYYGNSNPNVSYYAFTAVVTDKTLQLEDQDWVTINYEATTSEDSMVIQKAFVKSDGSKNYVYKDDNGVLKKQEISVLRQKKSLWIRCMDIDKKGDILCLKIYAWHFREYGHI